MGLPVLVQSKGAYDTTGTTAVVTLDAPATPGNALIAACFREGTTDRTLTVTDDQGNTYADVLAETGGNQELQISQTLNIPAGVSVITLTASGSTTVGIMVFEVSGLATNPSDALDVEVNLTATSHVCADPGIDTAVNVFILAFAQGSGLLGTITYPSGFTGVLPGSSRLMCAYRISASSLTGVTGAWSSSIARTTRSAICSFKGASAAVVRALENSTLDPLARPRARYVGYR